MCKLAPGPRCASHTKKNVRNSRKKVAVALRDVRENSRLYDEVATNPNARNSDVLAARARMEKSLEALRTAEEALREDQKAFDSTPTGQNELSAALASAQERGDQEEATSLSNRLDEAVRTREAQMTAHRILNSGESRLKKVEGESKANLDAMERDLGDKHDAMKEAEEGVRQARAELNRTRQRVDELQTSSTNALNDVKASHAAIATKVRQAYLDAGVPASRAEHYTADTMHSIQSAWEYLSENSADRAPVYRDDFGIKVKGFEHEDNLATAAAEDSLSRDEEFGRLRQEAARAHAAYAGTLEPLKTAKAEHKVSDAAMAQASDAYSAKRGEWASAARKFDVAQATVASGMDNGEYYDVDRDRFVASAYRNPDGTTNAHVLVKHPKRAPMYLAVTDISRDNGGAFLRLSTGDKVYATEMSARALRLTRPSEGSTRLFNRSR